jgi:hypothetical protein
LSFAVESADGAQRAYDSCYDKHLNRITHYWFHSNVPSGDERDAMVEEFRACLTQGGVDVSTVPRTEDLGELLRSIQQVVDSESEEFTAALICIDVYRLLYPEGVAPL